jgi:hypothetical protein
MWTFSPGFCALSSIEAQFGSRKYSEVGQVSPKVPSGISTASSGREQLGEVMQKTSSH